MQLRTLHIIFFSLVCFLPNLLLAQKKTFKDTSITGNTILNNTDTINPLLIKTSVSKNRDKENAISKVDEENKKFNTTKFKQIDSTRQTKKGVKKVVSASTKKIDTSTSVKVKIIYVDMEKDTYINFPFILSEDHTFVNIGTEDYQISYKMVGNILKIQTNNSTGNNNENFISTNMLVQVDRGKYLENYYFNIFYKKLDKNFIFNVSEKQAYKIAKIEQYKITPNLNEEENTETDNKINNPQKNKYYSKKEKALYQLILSKKNYKHKNYTDIVDNIALYFHEIFYYNECFYLKFTLENNSDINYRVATIATLLDIGNKAEKATSKEEKIEHLDIYNEPNNILGNNNSVFIIKIEKLSLSANKRIIVQVAEEKGERDPLIILPHFIINRATAITL